MSFNCDGRFFRTVSNTPGGETGTETVFQYRQQGDIVWATYRGGGVVFGTLLAKADADGRLDMRYQQLNRGGEWRRGRCCSELKVLEDGRYRLHESWQWLTSPPARPSSKSYARLIKVFNIEYRIRVEPSPAGSPSSAR